MDYQELTPKVRAAMLAEYNAEQASPSQHKPEQLQNATPKIQERFHTLLRTAIQNGDGNSLQDAVTAEQLLGDPWNARMSRSEFSFWYVRGLSAVILEDGETHCEIYLADDVREPHDNCTEYEDAVFDLNTLRAHQSNSMSPFSMPHSPWCQHLIRRPRPKDEFPERSTTNLTEEQIARVRKAIQAGQVDCLPGETDAHSVYNITFENGCTYIGRTTHLIVEAEERVCGIPNGVYQWGANTSATQHAAVMSRKTICIASSLSDRQARNIQRYLMQNLPAGLHADGNAMTHTDDCGIEAANQQMGLDIMRRYHEGTEST